MKTNLFLLMALVSTTAMGAVFMARSDGDSPPAAPLPKATPAGDVSKTSPASSLGDLAKTPQDVVERLDALIQPRFLLRGSEFGLSRIYIPLNSHQFVRKEGNATIRTPLYALVGADAEEKRLIESADAAKEPYVIGFVHSARTLGKPDDKSAKAANASQVSAAPPPWFETLAMHTAAPNSTPQTDRQTLIQWQQANIKTVNEALKQPIEKARKGEKVELQSGNWLIALRPVKASNESCLGCHGKAKLGDTLGVMAYAVHNEPAAHPETEQARVSKN